MRIEESKENKILFGFMKDNIRWFTSYDENTKRCRYHNPFLASAYGLQFHKEEKWLKAVLDKIQDYIEDHKINMYLNSGLTKDNIYCFQVYFAENFEKTPYLLYHLHDKNYLEGLKLILVQIVQDLTFKYN